MESLWLNFPLLALSIVLIAKGGDLFTDGAVRIAELTHVPKVIIGATIVSICTTAPEFTVSVIGAVMGHADVSVGNATGSVICNTGLIFALGIVVSAGLIERQLLLQQGGIMIAAGATVYLLSLWHGELGRFAGALLILGLFGYVLYSIRSANTYRMKRMAERIVDIVEDDPDPEQPLPSMKKEVLIFVIGAVLVVAGSRLLVYSGLNIAHHFGVSELIISLTVVAIGTSLPELATCVSALVKGHQEVSVGNILGANILNFLWVLGTCSLIRPLPIQRQSIRFDFPTMLLLMLLMVGFGVMKKKYERWNGGLILAIYVGYVTLLFTVLS